MRRAPLPTLRAAFERTGSPAWVMRYIQEAGLDRAAGFRLQVDYQDDHLQRRGFATEAALQAGDVDFIDTDWLSVARFRTQGMALSAVYPYGRILGGLLLRPGLPATDLPALQGCTLGVVSRRDKNLFLANAYAQTQHAFNLRRQTRLREAGSKTRLAEWLLNSEVDAALVYWHQAPALQRQGCHLLLDMPDVLTALGFPAMPTTFFVFNDHFIATQRDRVRAFVQAYDRAVNALSADRAAWAAICRDLGVRDTEEAKQLQSAWQRRIAAGRDTTHIQQLPALYQRLAQQESQEDLGLACWPSGVFSDLFMPAGATA